MIEQDFQLLDTHTRPSIQEAVWIIPLSSPTLSKGLSKEETALVREAAIASVLGVDKETVRLKKTPTGKPFLEDMDIAVSITTCGPRTLIALNDSPIGIDAEPRDRRIRKADSLMRRWFSLEETAWYNDHPSLESFLKLWTMKEAYVKYTGEGISDRYSSFSVFSVPQVLQTLVNEDDLIVSVCLSKKKDIVIFPAVQEEAIFAQGS